MLDVIKAMGCVVIIWHHLAVYSPMFDRVMWLAPDGFAALYNHGQLAVQTFLVVAGFLSAAQLLRFVPVTTQGLPASFSVPRLLAKRYLRLAIPLMAALTLTVCVTALVRPWYPHDSLSDAPRMWTLVVHVLMLQDLLRVPALSAGIWYVAIDFQLFLITAVLAWLVGRSGVTQAWLLSALLPALVAALTLASLLWFNLDDSLDHLGLYFFGAYGLGALAWWASRSTRPWLATLAVLAIGAIALVVEYRLRIAVTLAVALLLSVAAQTGWLQRLPVGSGVQRLGQMSYSLFLIHFPISLVVSAAVTNQWPALPWWQVVGMLTSVLLSLVAGWLLYHGVERRLG